MNPAEANQFDDYLYWITPRFGDPTYSLIRAHLKFEELLNRYLDSKLPHAKELEGARLSFSQKVSLSRAISNELPPSDWRWTALGKLNKLRNLLAHDLKQDVASEIDKYVEFCVNQLGSPVPPTDTPGVTAAIEKRQHVFTAADLVTGVLYGVLELRLITLPLEKSVNSKAVGL